MIVPPILINKKFKLQLRLLGSDYGGKVICPELLGANPFVISGGAGEDISFDVQIAKLFDAQVVIIDPTPKSEKHWRAVSKRFGKVNEIHYNSSGSQNPKSYNLHLVNPIHLQFYPYALWEIDDTEISLFPPKNLEHSSFSIDNLQKSSEAPLKCKTISIEKIMKIYDKNKIDILKLDIEGSEFQVLQSCFSKSIFPNQILVEIDEMYYPSLKNYLKSLKIIRLLQNNGYTFIARGNSFDYCAIRKSNISTK